MSDELLHQDNKKARFLRDDEKMLLTALLSKHADFIRFKEEIARGKVCDMSDGGMGSVKFVMTEERSLGGILVEADYFDGDGVPVVISINADENGNLYEMDFWKTDFSPLIKYPQPESVLIKI
jgi:hypothetical protein